MRKKLLWIVYRYKTAAFIALCFCAAVTVGFVLAAKTGFTFSSSQKLDNEFLACVALSDPLQVAQCVKTHASSWIAQYGLASVSSELDAYENRFGADFTCHLAGHQIGEAAAAQEGNLLNSLSQCTEGCYSSCVHGVLIEHTVANGVSQLLALHPEKYCSDRTKAEYRLCIHGLGHGFMIGENYDIASSIHDCNLLNVSAVIKTQCYSGVYMELAAASFGFAERDISKSLYSKKGDLFYPCDTAPTNTDPQYQRQCYLQKVGGLLSYARAHKQSIFDICNMAPAGWVSTCVEGVGFAQVAHEANYAAVRGICSKAASADLQNICLFGAYAYIAVGEHGAQEKEQFCRELPSAQKVVCSPTYRTNLPGIPGK